MSENTKKLIKLYANAVDNDIDKLLEFQELLSIVLRDFALEIEEEFYACLEEQEHQCENDECHCYKKNYS